MNLRAAGGFYRTLTRVLLSLIACSLLPSGLIACAAESASDTAARLVRAMQMDKIMLVSMQLPLRRGHLRNQGGQSLSKDDERFYSCVYAIDSSIFVVTYADVLVKEMSIEEMRVAIRFLEGEVGKKYVQRGVDALPELFGLPEFAPKSKLTLSKEELAAVEQFANTPAGSKLMRQKIFERESIQFATLEKWKQALANCVRSVQPAK